MNKNIIIGTLLGDAWIQKQKYSYNFAFEQVSKEYALWKADKINLPYKFFERDRFDKRTNKTYHSCVVYFNKNKSLKKEYYNLFYTSKKKVSLEILDKLDDEGVCIWFLDDGNTYYNSNNCHIKLAVNGFVEDERNLIIKWFKDKYDLNFKHSQKAIRLTSKIECEKFMDIVEKYIPNCMEYKKLSVAINKYKVIQKINKIKYYLID